MYMIQRTGWGGRFQIVARRPPFGFGGSALTPPMTPRQKQRRRLLSAAAFCCLLCVAPAAAQPSLRRTQRTVLLGETAVTVNVYEKEGGRVTFFAPHHNERNASAAARDAVARNGGRLVEVVSYDEKGAPARNLRFRLRGRGYVVDPNRIFTENGRRCAVAPEAGPAVEGFAAGLLEIVFAAGGRRLRDGESFVVAVHNNADSDEKIGRERAADLTAAGFLRAGRFNNSSHGPFQEQAAGVYLSNREADEDNFVLVSTPRLMAHFAESGFHVVVQKPAAELRDKRCGVDDGSLSVYSAQQGIPYVNLEADARSGGPRQREMLGAIYELLPKAAVESQP